MVETLASAAATATRKAIENKGAGAVGIYTMTGSAVVIVGIATQSGACAVAIDRAEYDGLKLMEMFLGSVHDEGPARRPAAGG